MIVWLAAFADVPRPQLPRALDFWTDVTASTMRVPRGPRGEFVPVAAVGEDPSLWLQAVDRPIGAAGWHLDLLVDGVDELVGQATDLGARVVRSVPGLVTLESPAGQPFCLVAAADEHRRALPRAWPGGHRSLLDQFCLDLPARSADTESQFWTALTGWERIARTDSEFETLIRPSGLPLRLLLQRLGPDDDGPVRAHVDIVSDDVAAERERHEKLGATVVRVTPEWTTMRDPVGLLYCLAARDPARTLEPTQ